MRILTALLILLFFSKSTTAQKEIYDGLATIKNRSLIITDSLIKHDVDTFVCYYVGSAGCPTSPPKAIIYWEKNDLACAIFLTTKVKYKRSNYSISMFEQHFCKAKIFGYDFSFFDKKIECINSDASQYRPNPYTLNYIFEEINVMVGKRNLKYDIANNSRRFNWAGCKLLLIDNFRSFCLDFLSTE